MASVRDELFNELRMLGAKAVVLSSNLKLRQDGLPMANQSQPWDPGVAVYFTYKGKQVCFACDRWNKVEDNMQAVRHTIDALRGIARWGTGDMVDAAFSGFKALPYESIITAPPWWNVLGVESHTESEVVQARYRQLAMKHHPDRGGDQDLMSRINAAYESFKQERGVS